MRKFCSCERGQAVVEFALVIPVLILILMGVFEFGRIFHAYLVVTEAARDAARYASVGVADSQIGAVIQSDSQSLDPTQITYSISPDPSLRQSGQPVTVTVNYPVELITPVLNVILPNPTMVQSTITMRKE